MYNIGYGKSTTVITGTKREIVGKKVRKLRREGFIPANIYGKSVISTSIQIKEEDFNPLFKEVGQTGLIDIEINGEKKTSSSTKLSQGTT